MVYLDDIFIYLKNKSKHVEHVKQVLKKLCAWGLYTKFSKCFFYTKLIKFFGYFVTLKGIIMDPAQIKAIEE